MSATIQCPICQKEYRWQPELAGKQVQCVCGQALSMPTAAPVAETEELYDLVDEPAPKHQHAIADLQSTAVASTIAVGADGRFACPYCGERIEIGSSMCVFCGSVLEAAVVPESARRPVLTAEQSAPPVSIRPVVMRAPTRQDNADKIKLIAMLAITLAVLICGVVAIRRFTPHAPARDPNLRPEDAEMLERVASGGSEARAWLKADEGRSLTGMLRKQSVFKIDQWYEMGAVRVIVFGLGSPVAIELPKEPAKRKAIFEWQRKWAADYKFKIESDIGQKWLEIPMHL